MSSNWWNNICWELVVLGFFYVLFFVDWRLFFNLEEDKI